MKTREFHPGMGRAVAERTILRPGEDWGNVADRVALGNTLLTPDGAADREGFRAHLRAATILMSGRHLQHGDADQPNRPMEVYTNCSTAAASFLLFYLLLNGSGVGRAYDDDLMVVNWDDCPTVRCVLDEHHADFDFSAHESLNDARHKYGKGANVHWFEVPDSREGWAQAIELMETMAFQKAHRDELLVLDFSAVRCKGSPIGGMQGRPSSGPVPMMNALHKIATLKGAGLPKWLQAIYVDHYLAEPVLVGGARRAARMATKIWTDKSVLDFIRVKRPLVLDGLDVDGIVAKRGELGSAMPYPFLWSSNNSIGVTKDFWRRLAIQPGDPGYNAELTRHAREVHRVATECAYADGTGEPGYLNVDMLTQKDKGRESLLDGSFVGSQRYQVQDVTRILLAAIGHRVTRKSLNTIVNPCGEIPLAVWGGYCVHGSTKILTKDGYKNIQELVGQTVDVFNGSEWSSVAPFQTGSNAPMVRVKTSDGAELVCTPYHRFSIRRHRQRDIFDIVHAEDLKCGMLLPTFRVPDGVGVSEPEAYTYGAFLGDGSIERRADKPGTSRYLVTLYAGKHHLPVTGSRGSEHANNGVRVTVSHLDHGKLEALKGDVLPDWVFELDRESARGFIRGWLDTDGCHHQNTEGVSISTSKEGRARGLQLLLRQVGISFSSVRCASKAGEETNFGPRTEGLWQVYIPKSEASLISGYRVVSETTPDLDRVVAQPRVVSVEPVEGLHDSFCFYEPKRGMGVFGNMLTHQCVIADNVPFHAETFEEVLDAGAHSARALIRVNTMDSLYRKETARTNRIGVGQTGVHEFAWKFFRVGFRDLVNPDFAAFANLAELFPLEATHLEVVKAILDNHTVSGAVRAAAFWEFQGVYARHTMRAAFAYADELGVNRPHTVTTIKPAGTTSKLFGLSEGWHLPAMAYYLRWVQFRHDDPLVAEYRLKGYPFRELTTYSGTVIIGFPTEPTIATLGMGDEMVLAADATPQEQYNWLRFGEFFWIEGGTVADYLAGGEARPGEERHGGQISYTLKYKFEDTSYEQFLATLTENQGLVRACSVMPQTEADTAAYEYLPEQPVSKIEYESIARGIAEQMAEDIGREHIDCASGACPVDFVTR